VVVVLVAELDVLAQIMLGHVMPPSGRILAEQLTDQLFARDTTGNADSSRSRPVSGFSAFA
jgi:hypothetical protein